MSGNPLFECLSVNSDLLKDNTHSQLLFFWWSFNEMKILHALKQKIALKHTHTKIFAQTLKLQIIFIHKDRTVNHQIYISTMIYTKCGTFVKVQMQINVQL